MAEFKTLVQFKTKQNLKKYSFITWEMNASFSRMFFTFCFLYEW